MNNRLSGALFEQFQQALCDAFRSRSDFEQLTRVRLEQNLNAINGSHNITEISRSLIDWAESRGKLSDLISGALAENLGNPELKAFEQAWRKANQPRLPADVLVHDPATIEPLSDAKFMFLFFVYDSSEANKYAQVELRNIQNLCNLPKHRAASIATFLAQKGLIEFKNVYINIKILHKGIVAVESRVLGDGQLPDYISHEYRNEIQQRVDLRYDALSHVFDTSKGNTTVRISGIEIAQKLGVTLHRLDGEIFHYLDEESLILLRGNTTVSITENGIDCVDQCTT